MTLHTSTVSSTGTEGSITGGGARYQTMSAWENAQQAVHSTGDQSILECYRGTTEEGAWQENGELADNVILYDWVGITETDNITIKAAADNQCNGLSLLDGGTGFRVLSTTGGMFTSNVSWTVFEDVELASEGGTNCIRLPSGEGHKFKRCIISCNSASNQYVTSSTLSGGQTPVLLENCISILTGGGVGRQIDSRTGWFQLYNCTFDNKGTGLYGVMTDGDTVMTNCVAVNAATEDIFGAGGTLVNCASSDSSAYGTAAVTGVSTTTDFEGYASGDYRPTASGALDGTGFDNSAAGYTDDIAGNARGDGGWEIGAFEIAGAAPVDSNLLEGDSFTTLSGAITLVAETGTFSYTGNTADFVFTFSPLVAEAGAFLYSGGDSLAVLPATIREVLVDQQGNPQVNLTGLKWAWFDEATPDLFTTAVATAADGTTDASGVFTAQVGESSLVAGEVGWLDITDSDGLVATEHKGFSGPSELI